MNVLKVKKGKLESSLYVLISKLFPPKIGKNFKTVLTNEG